jgi:iron complex transport system substrate-binding protein
MTGRTRLLAAIAATGGLALSPSPGTPQSNTVTDDVGTVFVLGATPRRIVSLAPNITEILFALGLGDRIAGVTRYCDYPPEARAKAKIGGFIDPSVEKIRALDPDLVIAFRGNPWEALNGLKALKVPVFILDIGERLEAVPETIAKIGRVTRREDEAQALLSTLAEKDRAARAALARTSGRPRVFLNLAGRDLMTCGRTSYLHDLIERAGGINIAASVPKTWSAYSREQLIRDDPDVVIILAPSEADFASARDWFIALPGLDTLRAVRAGRVRFLDENAASRVGPRLYDAFADLVRLIHGGGTHPL